LALHSLAMAPDAMQYTLTGFELAEACSAAGPAIAPTIMLAFIFV